MIEIKPEKLKNETDEEYSMFLSYVGDCAPNPARSIEKVAAKFCLPVQDVREISINKLWGARAAQFDIQYVKDRASDKRRERVKDAQNAPQSNLESALALSLLSRAGNELNRVDDEESLSAALRLLSCYQALKQKG